MKPRLRREARVVDGKGPVARERASAARQGQADEADRAWLASCMRALRALAPGLGHDLRGALNAISLHTELIRASSSGKLEHHEKNVRLIGQETEELGRTLGALLRMLGGPGRLSESVDWRQAIGELVGMLRPAGRRRSIEVSWEAGDRSAEWEGVRGAVTEPVLVALVETLESIEDGGTLRVELTGGGRRVALRAIGSPIDESAAELESCLHMASQRLARQGGSVTVSSGEGRSRVVQIVLPTGIGSATSG